MSASLRRPKLVVLDQLDRGRRILAAFGPGFDREPLPALDDDVHAAVVERVDDVHDPGQCPDAAAARPRPRAARRRSRRRRCTRRSAPCSAARRCAAGRAPTARGRARGGRHRSPARGKRSRPADAGACRGAEVRVCRVGANLAGLFRPAVRELVAYEPGKPVEELQRELGLTRIVKLASNEGTWGPFPAALEAIARSVDELNRYPDGGAYRLRGALAERHDVRFEQVAPGSGADAIVDYLSQAMLDPGDEIVCGWPSFPSYAIDARKMGAVPRLVPLRDHRYDLEAMLGCDRRADEDRLPLPPEQPDRHVEHPRRARPLLRRGARPRADGRRPGVLRVRRRLRAIPTRSTRTSRRATTPSCCGRSRRSTGSPACASATASARQR